MSRIGTLEDAEALLHIMPERTVMALTEFPCRFFSSSNIGFCAEEIAKHAKFTRQRLAGHELIKLVPELSKQRFVRCHTLKYGIGAIWMLVIVKGRDSQTDHYSA